MVFLYTWCAALDYGKIMVFDTERWKVCVCTAVMYFKHGLALRKVIDVEVLQEWSC